MARSTTAAPATRNGTNGANGTNGNGANGAKLIDYYVEDGLATIGQGRPIERSTLVQTAQRRAALHDFEALEVPNMVEMQLESYQWFLNTGLRELFSSFSPIEDFTGTMSLEFLDYSLGEPKFDPDECRERDLTYEMPMKVKVRVVNKETGELKESEVYLGELPCMTERGTFIINGAERVVVSQLSRSPGVYFKEEIAYSGRRLLQMQIIPHEGAWVDAEVSEEATKDIAVSLGVKIGQSKRMPITTLLRAFSGMDVAQPHAKRTEMLAPTAKNLAGRVLAEQLIDYSTGEIIAEEGQLIDEELQTRIRGLRDNPKSKSLRSVCRAPPRSRFSNSSPRAKRCSVPKKVGRSTPLPSRA
jgi:DNA-directed RNA polymerase subunit beta